MTAALAHRAQPAKTPRRNPSTRPKLEVLDQAAIRRRARRRNFVLFLFLVVLGALFAVAFVHASLVETQQDLDHLRSQVSELEAEKAQIERAVDEASSPDVIMERAVGFGMVRAEKPLYLAAVAPLDGE